MIYLETNALIRFFTKDDEIKASKVKKLLKKEKEIAIADVVFPEIEYVLRSFYKVSREEIIQAFRFIISRPNIKISFHVEQAVTIYERTSLDMADCIIAVSSISGKLASFDGRLLKVDGVKKYW